MNIPEHIKEGLSEHKATLDLFTKDGDVQIARIVFANPGTVIYRLDYLFQERTLIVTGDCESAIYRWTNITSPSWVAGLNIGYFASKCEASPHGRLFRSWDDSHALKELNENYLNDTNRDRFHELRGLDYLGNKSEWFMFLYEHASELFGPDPYGWPSDAGEVIDLACHIHLYGLKQAVAMLQGEEVAA